MIGKAIENYEYFKGLFTGTSCTTNTDQNSYLWIAVKTLTSP